MTDWLTIRVVLQGARDSVLEQPPGRVFLAHADHAFGELAEAIDTAFGRWDPTPAHEFEVEGRLLAPLEYDEGVAMAREHEGELEPEDSEEVTVGEVGLRLGAQFSYVFDSGFRWSHTCVVDELDVDPYEVYSDEPSTPVAIFGWGDLPDQYGRTLEDDEPELPGWSETLAELSASAEQWADAEEECWQVVDAALRAVERPYPDEELSAAAAELRRHEENDEWPYDVLWAAAGLDDDELPDADQELWLELAAGVVAPRDALPLDPDIEAAWAALEAADWAGAVIELVRAGEGEPATASAVLSKITHCPEIDNGELSEEDRAVLLEGLETVLELWRALRVVDGDDRLTALGRWGLPEALRIAWTREFA